MRSTIKCVHTPQAGFTLVELMVSLVLGLIVIGGVISVFLSNQQSYRTNQALGEVQDNSRIAFELMARDIRDAGLTGCGNTGRVADVLNNGPTGGGADWWANWGNAIVGFDAGTADPAITAGMPARVAGTDSFELIGADGSGLSIVKHNATAATFFINAATTNIQQGDIIIVCDPDHAAITQVTNYNASNTSLVHNTGTGNPGNCSKGLGFPTSCTTNGNSYTFGQNSQIAELNATDWYIGTNSVGGRSLYRISLVNNAGTPTPTAMEMVRNVSDMQVLYHVTTQGPPVVSAPNFVSATTVSAANNWGGVDAVQVTLTLQSENQRAGTNVQPIQRSFTVTTTLRNRVN